MLVVKVSLLKGVEGAFYGQVNRSTLIRHVAAHKKALPMSVVLEMAGLPFALNALDRVVDRRDGRVLVFKAACSAKVPVELREHTAQLGRSAFSAYTAASISLELTVRNALEREGLTKAVRVRKREIARQTRLFKELFCAGDGGLLPGGVL